jgi:hypothetical protein
MEEVGEKVGRMLNEEASRGKVTDRQGGKDDETTIEGLSKRYPWWIPAATAGRSTAPSEKTEDTATLFEEKNTRV